MIIVLTQCYPPRIGGIENLVFNLSLHLSKYEKVLVLADQHNIIDEILFDKNFKNDLIIKRFGGLKYFRKRNKFRELKKINDLRNIKAIISDSWKSIEYPIAKFNNNKIPFICLAHGNEVIIKNNRHQQRIFNIFTKVNKIVSNSEFTKNLLKKVSPQIDNIEVIYPGVSSFEDIIEEEVNLIDGSPTLLTLARLEKRKGHENILQVISKLKDRYPNIRYIIAGEGEEKSYLKSLVNTLNIYKNVNFIGSVTDAQKKYIFNKTDLMVMPTLDETNRSSIEGFGITYIEASLFGIPSIASNVGGTKEAVLHNKTGLILDNLNDLENNICELIENKEKRKLLGENAKNRAQNELNWNNQVKKYLNLISNLSK